MRKLIFVFLTVAVLLSLCFPVSAANSATSAQVVASVTADGGCEINMTVTVQVDEPVEKLYFPVPAEAVGISLNGSRVTAVKSGTVRRVNLSRLVGKVAGTSSFHIRYTLHDVIHSTEAGTLEMQLPLLNGFDFGVKALQFSVTLPGAVEAKPAFVSGYHKAAIEEHISCTVNGMTVNGTSLKELKDHETLTMHIAVSEEMFPRTVVQTQSTTLFLIGMAVCGVLALLYWLIFMWNLPRGREETTEPPEGFDAGTVGSILSTQGVDMSLTVLTWAQLGYLMIRRERGGKIVLYKRMDMGNERNDFEREIFYKLFRRRRLVDTGSLGFAQLHRDVSTRSGKVDEMFREHSGPAVVFRVLAAGIGLFGGTGIGLLMGSGALLRGFLMVLMGAVGGISGWLILPWAGSLRLRRKPSLVWGPVMCVFWILLALAAGDITLGLWMTGGLLVAGLFHAVGGRRTELGEQTCQQLRGLRRYLRGAEGSSLRNHINSDPDYFFRMLPYAMALGVDKQFAQSFGSMRLDDCPYLQGAGREGMTAMQWRKLLQKILADLEDRARTLPVEKFVSLLQQIRRR